MLTSMHTFKTVLNTYLQYSCQIHTFNTYLQDDAQDIPSILMFNAYANTYINAYIEYSKSMHMGLGKSYTVINTYFNTYLQDIPSMHMASIHTFNAYWSLKYARGWVHWKQPGVCIEGYRVCLDGVEWPQYVLTYVLKGGCLDGICIEHMHWARVCIDDTVWPSIHTSIHMICLEVCLDGNPCFPML